MHRPAPRMADEDDLLRQVRGLAAREGSVCDLLGLDPAALTHDAGLLAAVLAGMIPEGRPRRTLERIAGTVLRADATVMAAVRRDLQAAAVRNLEPGGVPAALLFYRGFHVLLAHRVSHHLWREGAMAAALAVKTVLDRRLAADIHPAARIGGGVWFDHGLGIVIGETSVIEDDVSMWHGVTLGSTLKQGGLSRHPKIRRGATIGAGALLLGDIEIGAGAVVAAGAVVLADVPAHATAAGVPARLRARRDDSFRGFVLSPGGQA